MGLQAAVREARRQLTGPGPGEKPAVIQVRSATVDTSAGTANLSTQADRSPSPVEPGQIVARFDPAQPEECRRSVCVS